MLRRQHAALKRRARHGLRGKKQAGPLASCEVAGRSRLTFEEFLSTVRNPWTRRSFRIANDPGYVDSLLGVYETEEGAERPLSEKQWREISRAYDARDDIALLEALYRLKTFPVKGIDVNLLRTSAGGHLSDNSRAARRLARRIYSLGKEELRSRCEAPASSSRKLGPAFRAWLHEAFAVKEAEEFLAHSSGACVLDGSDDALMAFAREHLGYEGAKGLDGIIKVNATYLPLEAKLMSAVGGGQDRQLEDALKIHERGFAPGVRPLAVVDGQHLMFNPAAVAAGEKLQIGRYRQMIAESEGPVVSALLLEKLTEELAGESEASA